MKHIVLFGKVFYITHPKYGDPVMDKLGEDNYWLIGIYDTPIFWGFENIIIDKWIVEELYKGSINAMLLFIVYMLGFTWWLPVVFGILLAFLLYFNIKSLCSSIRIIVHRHLERIAYSKMTWQEKAEQNKKDEEILKVVTKILEELVKEEDKPKD